MGDGDIVLNLSLDDREFAVTVKNSGKLLRELRSDLDRAATGATGVQRHFNSFSTSLRHTVMSLAAVRFAAMDFYDAFLRLPSAILETSGEIERLTKLMGGLSSATTEVGRNQEALKNTQYILDLARKAPFEVRALSDSFVKLQAGGIDPLNGSMQALIDSVARFGGTSETLRRASVAIQQMAGKGVISMEELRQQLGEAVPTAMRMMAEGMGMSLAELTKQVSLGAVASGDALQRMFTVMEFYNKGAAADMMDTWTGLTSRLKTEWTILQTAIGESGFADAAKDQIKDLIKAMSSGEGVAMAKAFGQNLASLVRTLRESVDWLRENWSWIKALGQVMAAVFVASKIIAFGKAMEQTLTLTRASLKATYDESRNKIAMNAATAATIAKTNAMAAQEKAAQNAAELVRSEAHYATLTRRHAAYIGKIRSLEVASDIAGARAGGSGLAGAAAIAAQAANLKKLESMRKLALETKVLMAHERELQGVMSAGVIASTASAAAQTKMAQAAEATASKMGLLTKAGIGMRMAVGALGGPLGIVTTALMLGIPAWLEWGNSGEKAIRKIKDALNSGGATEETVGLITKQLVEKRRELYELENKQKGFSILPSNPEDVQRDSALKAQLQREIAELEADMGSAKSQKLKNEATARFKADKNEFDIREQETRRRFSSQAGQINAAADKEIQSLKKGSQRAIEVEKQKSLDLRNTMIASGEALHKIALEQHVKAKAAFDHAKKSGTSGDAAIAQEYLDEVNDKLLAASKFKKDTEHLLDSPQFKEDKVKKPGPLAQALEQSRADLAAAQIKMDDLLDGAISFDRLRAAAAAKIEGDRKSGRFSTKDARGNFVAPPANHPDLLEMENNDAKIAQLARETTAQKELNRLKALSGAELETSVSRFDNGFHEKETTGVHKLQRSLAALKQTLVEGSPAMEDFQVHAEKIISDQAIADLNNFAAGFRTMNADLKIAIEDSEVAKKQMSYDTEIARLNSAMEMRKQAIINNTKLTNEEVARLTKLADEQLNEHLRLSFEKHIKDMRTPLQQLTVNWMQTTDRLRDASTRWANDSMDALVQFVKGGKVEWRSLVDSILTDILRIQLQKTAGKALNSALESGMNAVAGMFNMQDTMGGSDNLPIDPATGAVKMIDVSKSGVTGAISNSDGIFKEARDKLSSMWDSVKLGFSNVWTSMTNMLGGLGDGLGNVFSQLGSSLTNFLSSMSGSGGGGGTLGMISSALGMFTQVAGAMSGGMGGMGGGATATASYTGYGGMGSPTMMRFAEGGIMSKFGALPLRRYAKGGIADTPQLAEFGEGSMPEAYVPLPDGRSIPVTMKGSPAQGGTNVAINIIINKDGSEDSSSNGAKDGETWNRIAQKVKTVVKEQLVIEMRPAGMLYK